MGAGASSWTWRGVKANPNTKTNSARPLSHIAARQRRDTSRALGKSRSKKGTNPNPHQATVGGNGGPVGDPRPPR
jgi:hypothetical protein